VAQPALRLMTFPHAGPARHTHARLRVVRDSLLKTTIYVATDNRSDLGLVWKAVSERLGRAPSTLPERLPTQPHRRPGPYRPLTASRAERRFSPGPATPPGRSDAWGLPRAARVTRRVSCYFGELLYTLPLKGCRTVVCD
jgi:hypothetical protein